MKKNGVYTHSRHYAFDDRGTCAELPAGGLPVRAARIFGQDGPANMAIVRSGYCSPRAASHPHEHYEAAWVGMLGWARTRALAGLFMEQSSLAFPLLIGGGLMIGYGVALYVAFYGIKAPQERQASQG